MKIESFRVKAMERVLRPCVYLFVKGTKPVYIGSSAHGFARFGSPEHHRSHLRQQCNRVVVVWVDTLREARELENVLIRKYSTQYCAPPELKSINQLAGYLRARYKRLKAISEKETLRTCITR